MNKCFLIGRLTRDPELRTSGQGVSVCTFSLAVDRPYKSADGARQTDFFNIVVWRQQAENCARYLQKGSQCAVEGNIQNRTYEKDGEKRYITEIVADRVEFLGKTRAEQRRLRLRRGSVAKRPLRICPVSRTTPSFRL